MRIVVVEDEPKTRQGLIKIIQKYTPHEVVAGECDGIKGLEAVTALLPDALIADINMPEMDGLTMLEKIRKRGIRTATVILTGYSEFDYAKRALKLEAVEYLLKPLNVEDIIEVLERINEKLTKTKVEMVSPEQLIFSMLTCEETEQENYAKQLEERLLLRQDSRNALILIKTGSMLGETVNEMQDALNQCLDSIGLTACHVFRLPFEQMLLMMIPDSQNVHYLREIIQMKVMPEMKKIGKCYMAYGEIKSMMELKPVLEQMQEYFEYSFVLDENKLIAADVIEMITFSDIRYPDNLEQRIRRDIRNGNKAAVQYLAGEYHKQVIESDAKPHYIKEYTVRFMMRVMEAMRSLKPDQEMDVLHRYMLDHIMEATTKEELSDTFWKLTEALCRDKTEKAEVTDTDNGMILRVIEYIRTHYNKDISLPEAAELVGITPEYLSKLFAKEMGINFSTFLGDFRISMAKRMFSTGKYKIYEVAEAVGFHDTKYFNKVFKSIVGVSPSEYRRAVS
ncbi:MAG: response regulator [bacterium]|nr:response regulator [bacterium]